MNPRGACTALLGSLSLAACLPAAKSVTLPDRPAKVVVPYVATPIATPADPDRGGDRAPSLPVAPTESPTPPPPAPAWASPGTYGAFGPSVTPMPDEAPQLALPADSLNVLLIGSDLRRGTSFRTDTLILVSIQPAAHGVVMLSIPRDLFVYLPGFGMQRINTAYLYGDQFHYPGGGLQLLKDAVRYNLGLTVDNFARIDMAGFQSMIDTLGGINVRVACPYTDWRLKAANLDQQNPDNWHKYTVPSGVVAMDGETALWYARAREKSSDFDRARRQQEVLRAIERQALQLGLLPRLPDLYAQLQSTITTDMTLGQILRLAPLAAQIDPGRIRSRFIGRDQVTSWTIPSSGAQVLVPKPEAIRALLESAFDFESGANDKPQIVEVDNATGDPSWTDLAIERLAYAGFEAEAGAQGLPIEPKTRLTDLSSVPSQAASAVSQALGLANPAVDKEPDPASNVAVRVTLGTDYRACYDPTRHQPG
jgi:LCP family protein required for cell wall assembly